MDILRDVKRKARKEYLCMFCGGVIKEGEEYNRQTISNDGKLYDFICHGDCEDIVTLIKMPDCGDGISPDEFEACIDNYVEEKHCGDEGWKNLEYMDLVRKIIEEIKKE